MYLKGQDHSQTKYASISEIDYRDNNSDLDLRLIKILNEVDVVMNIRTDFELK